MKPLGPGELHIWMCYSDRCQLDESSLQRMTALLDDHEQSRLRRFKFKRHADHFCLSHAMVREVLSQYADIEPSAWRFSPNEFGKPFVDNEGLRHIQFSLSHTRDLILIGVAMGAEIGCDVEWHSPRVRCTAIAHRFFSAAEVNELNDQPEPDQRQRFFDFWALKESYIKAKGRGLALGLGKFSFGLNQRPISFAADAELAEKPGSWCFELLEVSKEHSAAYAFPGAECEITLGEYRPNSGESQFTQISSSRS